MQWVAAGVRLIWIIGAAPLEFAARRLQPAMRGPTWLTDGSNPPRMPFLHTVNTTSRISGRLRASLAITAMLLVFAGSLGGCAGTARGKTTSVYRNEGAVAAPVSILPRTEALVVIRYPAIISADAEHAFYQAFGNNAIGGAVPIDVKLRTDTTRVAQAVIAKTNYYVMSLYRELKAKLPENTVLLSPHMIIWDRDKGLHSRPMLASEQVPSVLTIDFSVYSYPDIRKIMDAPPLTFGDIVTPLVVVHSNRWLSPVTHGLLLSSEPLMQTSWSLSAQQAEGQFTAMLDYPAPGYQRNLDFITFLNTRNAAPVGVPEKRAGEGPNEVVAVEAYPLEKVQMNAEVIARLGDDDSVDPFAQAFINGAANRVLELLDSVDQERALFFARQASLQRFDPELANVVLAGASEESVRSRLQLASALIEAEKKFLAGQSQSVFKGTYTGDYGQKMRKMIQAEYDMLEERRHLARIQNVTTALAVAMLAGSVYGTSVSGSVIASALQNITGVLVLGSIWAVSSSLKTRAKSGKLTEAFMALMAPEIAQQSAVQLEWMESKEKITARGFAEFRDKTTALYQSRVRSLNASVDEQCVFRHPSIATPGRWYGACEDGLATGRGYGLARDAGASSVEYVGAAESGMASGTGGMIVQRAGAVSPVYFEGAFREGVPDGIVKVEEAGQSPRIREFRGGAEVGKATESQWQRLVF